jgi:hypothetical protein
MAGGLDNRHRPGARRFAQNKGVIYLKICAIFHIDFSAFIWYNINVIKRASKSDKPSVMRCDKPFEKILKKVLANLLTNPQKCGIIYMSKGESVRLSQRPKSNLFYEKEGTRL